MPSKISIHLSGYPNKTFDILAKMQPSVVKVFNQSSEMNIDAIRQTCPRAIIVYRQYTNLNYHGSADDFFAELGDTFNKLRGRGLLWEGINEPVVNSVDDAKALNAWYVRFAELMHAHGELVAGFSWSTGNPPQDKYEQVIPYIVEAAAAVDAHAFHEYYSIWGKEWDWGRYRAFQAALPAHARKPVVITEAGLDDNGDPYTGGYRGKKSVQEYLEILKAYDAVLMQDPYVLGATVFEWGDYGWPSFEIDPMIDLIANYVASTGGGAYIPTPWPTPTFDGQPTYAFAVTPTLILVGQNATLKWDVEGVREIYLDGESVAGHDSRVVAPTQTTTYTLRLILRDGSAKDLAATLTVKPVPTPTFAFTAAPETIIAGQSSTLKWDVDDVREVYLEGQGVTGHETRVVTPAQTKTYTLRVVLMDGSTKDLTATVTVVPQPAYTFTATPSSITAGQSATLAWEVQGARSIALQGQPVAAKGSSVVSPTETTAYVLRMVFWDNSTKDLTATVNITAAPLPPTYSFSASPASIAAGESATLRWSVSSAKTVTLNGQPVAAQGAQVVTPTQTTTYTLHIVFDDDSTQDLSTTVTVTSPQPGTTRAPTVVLTPENIAQLKTYPRPAQDNGRGLHFNMDLRDTTNAVTVAHLLSINARWTMIYAPDEVQARRAAQACWSAGIMPIVRIGKKVDEPFDPVPYVNALKAVGAPPYVQIYNEPGDLREWKNYPGDDQWVRIFAPRWAQAAVAVFDAGGYPGLQVLSQPEFDAAVDSVRALGRTDIWQRAFFALHNYGANHPPAYPYDPQNQADHPDATIFTDDTAVLNLLEYAKWMQDRIGFVLPIIGGEGGWEYGASEDGRYPKVEQPYHARYHAEMFNWFRSGVLSNGEPLPDYLFSVTPWIEGGWGADDWWGGPLGTKNDTINAVKSIPAFVRKFGWDSETPPPAPTYAFSATPHAIPAGGSATLQWQVTGARTVSLDGQAVAFKGSKVVSPAQTATYVLSIVFFDGSAKNLSVTVAVTATPPPVGLDWDARLDPLGVKLTRSSATPAWRLIAARYQDVNEAGGNHHVFLKVLNENDAPVPGIKFAVDWVGRESGDQPAIVTTDASGAANCPLWAAFDPAKRNGAYFVYAKGSPSDQVSGMGLPGGKQVNFVLTFKWDSGAPPPPPPPPSATFAAAPTVIAPGAASTLTWDATGASAATLNGESVPSKGTRVVTPTQTTAYVLHIVYPDGTTKDLSATVTVTGAPPPDNLEWDPRLDPLGVRLTRTTAAQGWRLIVAKFQDENESSGNHHIYFKILNANGTPAAGVKLIVDWNGRAGSDQPAVVVTDGNGEANCALWSILHLALKDGPYYTFVKDAPSDRVSGMGLPENRHVNFLLTFRYG